MPDYKITVGNAEVLSLADRLLVRHTQLYCGHVDQTVNHLHEHKLDA